jgi:hypothetical protein
MAYEHNLIELWQEIVERRYNPCQSICFIVDKPVKREVFAADFRDRIVHHLLYNYLSPVLEKHFIHDSYSCRKGKGTHYGIQRVDHFIRSCSDNYRKSCYILKMDIKGYFMAIDREILFEKLSAIIQINREKLSGNPDIILFLVQKTIFNDPVLDCIFRSHRRQWLGLPPTKSLFHAPPGKGLPIGNLTSQLFANFYLDDFDHFMKEKLKLHYYGRYVDDMVVFHPDLTYLKMVICATGQYLQEKLTLTLHPDKIYLQPYYRGVKFLGAMIKPNRIYIANRTKGNFFDAIERQNKIARDHKPTKEEQRQFLRSMNSYLGILRHYRTYRLRKRMLFRHLSAWWWNHVYLKGGIAKFSIK